VNRGVSEAVAPAQAKSLLAAAGEGAILADQRGPLR
jgi:hypothetical protein